VEQAVKKAKANNKPVKGLSMWGATLKSLRKGAGLTQDEVAGRLGISGPSWSRKEKGAIAIRDDELIAFAALVSLTPAELNAHLTQAQSGQVSLRGIPVLNRTVSGAVLDYREANMETAIGIEDRVTVNYTLCHDPQAVFVEVVGDTMEPELFAGDFLLVSPNGPTGEGKLVFVQMAGNFTPRGLIGRLHFAEEVKNRLMIVRSNPSSAPVLVERNRVKSIWGALQTIRNVR